MADELVSIEDIKALCGDIREGVLNNKQRAFLAETLENALRYWRLADIRDQDAIDAGDSRLTVKVRDLSFSMCRDLLEDIGYCLRKGWEK